LFENRRKLVPFLRCLADGTTVCWVVEIVSSNSPTKAPDAKTRKTLNLILKDIKLPTGNALC
jgi:hypothetical protein